MSKKIEKSLSEKLMMADDAIYVEMGIDRVTAANYAEFSVRAASKAVDIISSRDYSTATILAACDVLDDENFHRMSRAVRFVIADRIPASIICLWTSSAVFPASITANRSGSFAARSRNALRTS